MDTNQRQSTDQNLQKLAETEGLSDIYAQDYKDVLRIMETINVLTAENTVRKKIRQIVSLILQI